MAVTFRDSFGLARHAKLSANIGKGVELAAVIGRSLKRVEDQRFLLGRGTFVDDVALENAVYAAFVRSPHAHAVITEISIEKAQAMPGVLTVLTGRDWATAGLGRSPGLWLITSRDGTPMNEECRPMIVDDRVRHVGDTVAVVIAEQRSEAQDAASCVEIDYQIVPAVTDADSALRPDAPRVHDEFDVNQVFDWEIGDEAATDAAFTSAAHVTTLEVINNRLAPNPIEPRAVAGLYEPAGDHYTLWTTSQTEQNTGLNIRGLSVTNNQRYYGDLNMGVVYVRINRKYLYCRIKLI